MRLKENQIKLVCQKLLSTLRSKQLIQVKKSESEVLAKMESIFAKELKVEDEINREAERLLQQYAAASPGLDKEKMFQMIKKELIKKKGVIL